MFNNVVFYDQPQHVIDAINEKEHIEMKTKLLAILESDRKELTEWYASFDKTKVHYIIPSMLDKGMNVELNIIDKQIAHINEEISRYNLKMKGKENGS